MGRGGTSRPATRDGEHGENGRTAEDAVTAGTAAPSVNPANPADPANAANAVSTGSADNAGETGNVEKTVLRRLRIALTAFFALDGLIFAGWVVRIPAIKEQTGASASALGLALLGVSAGAVATMVLTGQLCHRFGNHRVTVAAGVLLPLSVALPPLTHSALALGLVLLLFGAAYGGVNVAMNSAAVDLVAALRRPVMPSFHAAFSLGGMLGAGLGGLVAGHLSPTRHLLLLTALGLAVSALAAPTLLRHPTPPAAEPPRPGAHRSPSSNTGSGHTGPDHTDPGGTSTSTGTGTSTSTGTKEDGAPHAPEPRPAQARYADGATAADRDPDRDVQPARHGRSLTGRTRWLVAALGLIALCTAYGEGALADWSALHLTDDLGASAGVAAAGYSVFAGAMTVGRLSGTALLERLGQGRALIGGGATAAAGMLLGSLAPSVWLALAGFVVTGLGLANIFPVAIGRAGDLAGPSGVAAASTFGYGGMLLGPVAIGFLADWLSLTAALTTVALLAGAAALVAAATRRAVFS